MLNEILAALFTERDQGTGKISVADATIAKAPSSQLRVLQKARAAEVSLLQEIDGTLPVLLAAAGRMNDARKLFPDSVLVSDNQTVSMSNRGRFDLILRALGPFPDIYFGSAMHGQALLALKPLNNGNWLLASQQTRYSDTAAFVGPEKQIKRLANTYRIPSVNLPNGRGFGSPQYFLLRVAGSSDHPMYNPSSLAQQIPSYVAAASGHVHDGFIRTREEAAVRAIASPQVFTEQWWENVQPPPDDFDWKAELINITDWDST